MINFLICFVLFFTVASVGQFSAAQGQVDLSPDSDITDETLLISRLMKNYDPASRPVFNGSKSVDVKFSLVFIQICDMDEINQILTSNVWLELEWIDERLVWNRSDYNNLDKIRIPCNRLWVIYLDIFAIQLYLLNLYFLLNLFEFISRTLLSLKFVYFNAFTDFTFSVRLKFVLAQTPRNIYYLDIAI